MSNDLLIKNRYSIKNLDTDQLGAGSYGAVYVGLDTKKRKKVAIKVMKNIPNSFLTADESRIMKLLQCKNSNIVCYIDSIQRSSFSFLIMEYIKGTELKINYDWSDNFKNIFVKNIFFQVASGLAYMHSRNIIHMDIKPQNIMMEVDKYNEPTGLVKIVDLGFACNIDNNCPPVGSPYYTDPYLRDSRADYTELDIYSFGLTLFVLLYGDSFIQGEDKYRNPTDEEVETWSKSEEITKLHPIGNYVIQMINKNPNDRPSSFDLVQAVKQGFPEKININPKEKII